MFREFGNSIKAVLYDRAVSPLSGVIAIVWVAFNWKPLIVLFWGAGDVTARIAYIETHYVDLWRNLYYPGILSAAILVVYPFAALAAYALWEKIASFKLKLKQKFEGTVALPISKSIAIWTEMREKDRQFNIAIEAKDNRILELGKINETLSNELGSLKDSLKGGTLEAEVAKRTEELARTQSALKEETAKNEALKNNLEFSIRQRDEEVKRLQEKLDSLAQGSLMLDEPDHNELMLLLAVADAEEKDELISEIEAIRKSGLTMVEGNYYMDALKNRNFLSTDIDPDTGRQYIFLTQSSRAYIVRSKGTKSRMKNVSKAPPPITPVK